MVFLQCSPTVVLQWLCGLCSSASSPYLSMTVLNKGMDVLTSADITMSSCMPLYLYAQGESSNTSFFELPETVQGIEQVLSATY